MSKEDHKAVHPVRRLLVTCLTVFFLTVVASVTVLNSPYLLNNQIFPLIESRFGVKIQLADTAIWPDRISLEKLQVSSDLLDVRAETASMFFSPLDLLKGRISISAAHLDSPVIQIRQARASAKRAPRDETSEPSDLLGTLQALRIERLYVQKARISLRSSDTELLRVSDFSISLPILHPRETKLSMSAKAQAGGKFSAEHHIENLGLFIHVMDAVPNEAVKNKKVLRMVFSLDEIDAQAAALDIQNSELFGQATLDVQDSDWKLNDVRISSSASMEAPSIQLLSSIMLHTPLKAPLRIRFDAIPLSLLKAIPGLPNPLEGGDSSGELEIDFDRQTLQASFSFRDLRFAHLAQERRFHSEVTLRLSRTDFEIPDIDSSVAFSEGDTQLADLNTVIRYQQNPEVKVSSTKLELDPLIEVATAVQRSLSEGSEGEGSKEAKEEDSLQNASTTEQSKPQTWKLDLDLAELRYQGRRLRSIQGSLLANAEGITSERIDLRFPEGTGTLALAYKTRASEFDVTLDIKEALLEQLAGNSEAGPAAKINSLHLNAQGSGASVEDIRNTLVAKLDADMSDLVIPHGLANTVPYNIILLPFDVLGKLGMLFPEKVLPPVIKQVRNIIFLGEGEGTSNLSFKQAKLKMVANDGNINLPSAELISEVLPDVLFEGSLSREDQLALLSKLRILGVSLPLPVKGSLTTPLPDVPTFAVELTKEIGMSPLSIATNLFSKVASLAPDEFRKELAEEKRKAAQTAQKDQKGTKQESEARAGSPQ